jgi:hypothetical protein
VDVDRDTAAVVGNAMKYHVARKKYDLDVVGKTTHRFVARVVEHLPHEVVETIGAGGPDVHTRTTPYGLEALKDGDVSRAV